ncbi:MAG: hypothetical protein JJ899_12145, partial [Alphaproteobacteria bacterium]|nr:hypothetical protein [Alphaproteobacteria bacterium]
MKGFVMPSAMSSSARFFLIALLATLSLLAAGAAQAQQKVTLPDYVIEEFGEPPAVPDGPLSDELRAALTVAFVDSMEDSAWQEPQAQALVEIVAAKDPRIVWLIADLMRFVPGRQLSLGLAGASAELLGIETPTQNEWGVITDHLIAWDIPAPPDYLFFKRAIFTSLIPGWDRIFVEGDIDWRHVSWGGVLIDDRPYD